MGLFGSPRFQTIRSDNFAGSGTHGIAWDFGLRASHGISGSARMREFTSTLIEQAERGRACVNGLRQRGELRCGAGEA